jgi:glycosyltransferase involved in cell wall biosynthesis
MLPSNRPLNIAIGVHGRFYAFDVAKALHQLGQEVTVFTNYPALPFIKRRFGIEDVYINSFVAHGVITRGLGRIGKGQLLSRLEPWLHQTFGQWLASKIQKGNFDVLNVYSGVAEEILLKRQEKKVDTICVLERASSHIYTQYQLLEAEAIRTNISIDTPSTWMIAREKREYLLAEHINLPSSFAKRTFLEQGVTDDKISVTLLGVNSSQFRASREQINARCERILKNERIQTIFVGQAGFRKGIWDLGTVLHMEQSSNFDFTLVGTVIAEAKTFVAEFPTHARVVGHQPQNSLKEWYAKADIFVFPTIEDGFAVVLAQAQAAGLPILATTNCSAPDFIEEGKSGWIVPIRAPERIVEQLEWCHANRPALAEMVRYTYQNPYVRDWLDVGRDYLTLMQRLVSER